MRLTINPRSPSPILEAEYLHQQRSIVKRRRRWWLALPGALFTSLSTFAVAFIFIITFGASFGLFQIRSMPPELYLLAFIVWFVIPAFVLLPTAVVTHFGLMLRTMLWASNSVPREKIGGTWDLLLLTGTTGREIVMGKWKATVQRAFPSYLRLALMRAGVLLWIIEWSRFRFEISPLRVDFEQYSPPLQPLMLILGIALIFAYTLGNLPVTAAVGMVTAFITKRAGANTAIAGVLRIVFFLVPAIATLMSFWLYGSIYYYNYDPDSFRALLFNVLQVSSYTFVDNGMIISYVVLQLDDWVFTGTNTTYLLTVIAVVGITWLYYAVVTITLLWVARRLAIRQAALDQRKKLVKRNL